MFTDAKRIEELRRELSEHNHRYYVLDDPSVTDADYDILLRKLQELEVEYPDLITPMGWGLAAFSDRVKAETYVAENGGTTATFTEIQELIRSGELDPSKLSSGDHEHDEGDEMGEMEQQDDG